MEVLVHHGFWSQARVRLKEDALALGFSTRTMLACAVAMYAAFFLQLEAPYWAALTVWIVAHPHPAQIWGKGICRVIGTVVGAVAAVVLTACFSQSPELFVGSLAVWLGLCTGLSRLLRNFHAYAAMLAGYTTAIVAVAVVETPMHIFETAVARATCVMLGVAAVALVSAIFHQDVAPEEEMAPAGRRFWEPNYREALLTALRSTLAMSVAGAFWIASASPTASGVLLLTGILCSLFASHPLPHHACRLFAVAIAASGAAAFVSLFFLMQGVATFWGMILSMALFLIPGGMLMFYPRTAFFGVGFTVNFMNQLQVSNPMSYNLPLFLNNLLASLAACVLGALAFLVIFPRRKDA